MALKAKLKLEGKTYDVHELKLGMSQACDKETKKPTAETKLDMISFKILSPLKENFTFYEWAMSVADVKSGEFILPLTDGIRHVEKRVYFERALCVKLEEFYNEKNSRKEQMYMYIELSVAAVSFGGGTYYSNKSLVDTGK